MLGIPDGQLRLQPPAERWLATAKGHKLCLVELLVNLSALLDTLSLSLSLSLSVSVALCLCLSLSVSVALCLCLSPSLSGYRAIAMCRRRGRRRRRPAVSLEGGAAVRCGFDSRSRPRAGAGRARLSTRAVGLRVDFSNDAVGVKTRVASALIFSSPDSGKCHALLGKSPACLAAMPGRDSRDERSG